MEEINEKDLTMKEIKIEDLTLEYLEQQDGEVLKVIQGDTDFYYKVHLKENNKKLIAFSNGAYDPKKSVPPVFMRSKWVDDFEANCVFIDDRTVHDNNLRLGWGIGTEDKHYLRLYIAFIKKIASLLEISNKDIMYFGSSAGGFMSIAMASMHKGTYAVVNNPQTYVNNYLPQYKKAVYKSSFPGMSEIDIIRKYSNRLSLVNIFARNKNVPKTYYLQNRLCEGDMKNHLNPFLDSMDKYKLDSKNINVILYNNKLAGHNPAGKQATINYVNSILSKQLHLY